MSNVRRYEAESGQNRESDLIVDRSTELRVLTRIPHESIVHKSASLLWLSETLREALLIAYVHDWRPGFLLTQSRRELAQLSWHALRGEHSEALRWLDELRATQAIDRGSRRRG